MYHRLDGKLVAVGALDLLQNVVNSAYFIYDPDYKWLNLGVVGALRELEYIRRVRLLDSTRYKWYELGDIVTTCPKVSYKLDY
jgi:arginyl-tRNA--protein-N-Asp/Glu arginylyltransferase